MSRVCRDEGSRETIFNIRNRQVRGAFSFSRKLLSKVQKKWRHRKCSVSSLEVKYLLVLSNLFIIKLVYQFVSVNLQNGYRDLSKLYY